MEGAAALRQACDQALERQKELKNDFNKQIKAIWDDLDERTAAYVATLPEPCYVLSKTDSLSRSYQHYDKESFIGVFTSYAAAAKARETRKQHEAGDLTFLQVLSRQEILQLFKKYDWAVRVDEPELK